MRCFYSRLFIILLCTIGLAFCALLAGCGSGRASSAASTSTSGTGTGGTSGTGTGGGGTGTGGGGGGGKSQSSPIVYISETGQTFSNGNAGGTFSGLIEAFALDVNSGVLSPISGSPFSTNYSTGGDMALAPGGAFAYVLAQSYPAGTCCIGTTFLLAYALDPASGVPTLKQALATGASEVGMVSVHPSGRFIYLTPYSDSSGNTGIGVFSVQSDNTVVFAGTTQTQSDASGSAVVTPDGKFLYTNSDGALVGNWGNNPCGLVNSNLWAFGINPSTGSLTPVVGSPFVFQRQVCEVGNAPQYITKQIDPSGQRLFVIDSGNATVTVFGIEPSTGALSQLPGTTKDSTGGFYSSAMDPLGRFLYVGSTIYSFTGFSLTANTASGTLPQLPGMPVQVTPTPTFDEGSTTMAIDSSGTFLFSNENEFTSAFSCCGPDALVEFKINPDTGALTQLPSNPAALAGAASRIVAAPPR